MENQLTPLFNAIIALFTLVALSAGVRRLYISPPKQGWKWVAWLGGMMIGISIFDSLVVFQFIQEHISYTWIILTPLISTALVVGANLIAQIIKYKDHQREADIERRHINNASV